MANIWTNYYRFGRKRITGIMGDDEGYGLLGRPWWWLDAGDYRPKFMVLLITGNWAFSADNPIQTIYDSNVLSIFQN